VISIYTTQPTNQYTRLGSRGRRWRICLYDTSAGETSGFIETTSGEPFGDGYHVPIGRCDNWRRAYLRALRMIRREDGNALK
jgi:hypothetical protein